VKWNDLTLLFLWIFLGCMTVLFWQNQLSEELFYEKLLIDRNLDTIAQDCLYTSMEGITEEFEPVINEDYLLEVFEAERDWIFGKGKVEIPLFFFTEKETEHVYRISEGKWVKYPISGFQRGDDTYAYPDMLSMSEAIKRTDEIQKILTEELLSSPNFVNGGKKYRFFLPYIETEEGVQKIEKTGLWYLFPSKKYRANGKVFDFFTYSGARCIRKN